MVHPASAASARPLLPNWAASSFTSNAASSCSRSETLMPSVAAGLVISKPPGNGNGIFGTLIVPPGVVRDRPVTEAPTVGGLPTDRSNSASIEVALNEIPDSTAGAPGVTCTSR